MKTKMGPLQIQVHEIMRTRYPMMMRGLEEARSISPDIVDLHFEECLRWVVNAYGEGGLIDVVEGYVKFTLEVNRAQQAYEQRGAYEFSTFAEANMRIYQQTEYMRSYYWGVFAILFCWSHYVELMDFFLKRFVCRLKSGCLIEVAPGHGAWGLIAIQQSPDMYLEGWDISPAALDMAPRMAAGADLTDRAIFKLGDATQLKHDQSKYDAAICSFMLEHLEKPDLFLKDFSSALKSGALAYVSLALTAAQTDHIFEFKYESEGILLAEAAGFQLIESRVARPMRLMAGTNFVPRVQAMLLRKK
jgi:2-polyprenyl-3-methyl-5-hydroxy-6-metoxy-1,4-benzoquinol methylase